MHYLLINIFLFSYITKSGETHYKISTYVILCHDICMVMFVLIMIINVITVVNEL